MPAEAGIQAVGDSNKFKDLDSRPLLKTRRDRFRGHDASFPLYDKVSKGEEISETNTKTLSNGDLR
jgi:hypothetical protein